MRILLAVDNTPESDAIVDHVIARTLPEDTSIEVLTVLHSSIPPTIPLPALALTAAYAEEVRDQSRDAPEFLDRIASRLRREAPVPAYISTKMIQGPPDAVIAQEAVDWNADVIVLGSQGDGPIAKAVAHSTPDHVLTNAPCKVEIVSSPR